MMNDTLYTLELMKQMLIIDYVQKVMREGRWLHCLYHFSGSCQTLKRVGSKSEVNRLLKWLLKPLQKNAFAEYTEKRERK